MQKTLTCAQRPEEKSVLLRVDNVRKVCQPNCFGCHSNNVTVFSPANNYRYSSYYTISAPRACEQIYINCLSNCLYGVYIYIMHSLRNTETPHVCKHRGARLLCKCSPKICTRMMKPVIKLFLRHHFLSAHSFQ